MRSEKIGSNPSCVVKSRETGIPDESSFYMRAIDVTRQSEDHFINVGMIGSLEI